MLIIIVDCQRAISLEQLKARLFTNALEQLYFAAAEALKVGRAVCHFVVVVVYVLCFHMSTLAELLISLKGT